MKKPISINKEKIVTLHNVKERVAKFLDNVRNFFVEDNNNNLNCYYGGALKKNKQYQIENANEKIRIVKEYENNIEKLYENEDNSESI